MTDNYLITGYWGEPHVTAENDRGINASIFGKGRYVLETGQQFRAEYIGDNTVRMYDGKLMNNGAAAGITAGEYVDLTVANAGQGKKRNDFIVFQYEKDGTGIETGKFVVVQGTETSGTASDPILKQQDLLSNEATLDQYPLYRVFVSGTAIGTPEKTFTVKAIATKAELDEATSSLQAELSLKATQIKLDQVSANLQAELSQKATKTELKQVAEKATTVYEIELDLDDYSLTMKGGKTAAQLCSDLENNKPVKVHVMFSDLLYFDCMHTSKGGEIHTFFLQTDDAYCSFTVRPDSISDLEYTDYDRVVESGTDAQWTYRRWASGRVELWTVRNVLIKSIVDFNPQGGISQYCAITNVPSYVPENAIIMGTSKNPFVVGVNARKVNEQLEIYFYALTDEFANANITIESQIPISFYIVFEE